MRAVIYCRVSTEEQRDNFSLPNQLRACREYCSRNGLEVAAEYAQAESAKTADRAALRELLEYCRKNKKHVQCVVVHRVSRFSRDKLDHFTLRTLLLKLGITLRSATEPIDDTPSGKFIEGVLASAAQFENDVKAERTRDGMLAAVAVGRWTHQAPLGYVNGPRPGPSLVVDPERAPIIRGVFQGCAEGRSERDVLRTATVLGLRTRRGEALTPQTLSAMLRNPLYAGRIELKKWGVSAKGDWEPLVSEAVFNRLQLSRGQRAKQLRRHSDFPLRGFVRCALCSTPLTASWSRGRGRRYSYYSCRKGCRVSSPKARLESLFVERLVALQPDSGYLRLFNAIVLDVWKARHRESEELRQQLTCRRDLVTSQLDQLDKAFIFQHRIDQATYDRQRDKLREDAALLDCEIHEATLDGLDVEGLLGFAEHVLTDAARLWDEASADQKLRLQRVFFPEGVTFDGNALGTAVTCLAFKELRQNSKPENSVASPTGFEPVFRP